MTLNGILQILGYLVVLTLVTKPMGIYLTRVFDGERAPFERILGPIERMIYAFCRIKPDSEMNWKQYGRAMVAFSMISTLAVYAIQRLQYYLPLNPQAFAALVEVARAAVDAAPASAS